MKKKTERADRTTRLAARTLSPDRLTEVTGGYWSSSSSGSSTLGLVLIPPTIIPPTI